MMEYTTLYTKYCNTLQEENLQRTLIQQHTISPVLDFSHNNYLGIATHHACLEAGYTVAKQYGIGATGSRLLSGNIPLMTEFENRIAIDKNTERALLFPTGYQANSTVLTQLVHKRALGDNALVFFDKANHASLYDALRCSNVAYKRFRHNDTMHLRECIERYSRDYALRFLVIESIYGMDGDLAPLEEYIALCKQHSIFLYIDEAHATGVLGERGYGLATHHDFTGIDYCIMGTFSKALGGMGAYIASSHEVIDYLITTCTGFMYSTALSPFLIGAMYTAWKLIPQFESERKRILHCAERLRHGIAECGYHTSSDCTHIIPLIGRSMHDIERLHTTLLQHGIHASYIRPPTVPTNAPRLRFAINSYHREEDIDYVLSIIQSTI